MRPLRIEITNLGAIPYAVIDFENVDIAAVCGPNGAGKSTACTIAPMFALFGTTKAGTGADDMVRTGTTEAGVIFDFEHQENIWRVARTRSTKGKGKTTLELQSYNYHDDQWCSQSGASIAETQKKIIDLLNLDEATFMASSMILQGRANEFTSKPAGQRKAILAQVLQLDQYELLQEKARAKVTETNLSLNTIKARITDIDNRLAERPAIEGKKFEAELKLADINKSIMQTDTELQTAQVEYSGLVAKAQQAESIREQAEKISAQIIDKNYDLLQQQTRIRNTEEMLANEGNILAKSSEYEQVKDQVTVLQVKNSQLQSLSEEGQRLAKDLTDVENTLSGIVLKIDQTEKLLADRPTIEENAKKWEKAVFDLSDCSKLRETSFELSRHLVFCTNAYDTAKARLGTEKTYREREIRTFNEKAAMLADAGCIDIELATCKFLADAKSARDKGLELQASFDTWSHETNLQLVSLKLEVDKAQEAMDNCGFSSTDYDYLQELVADLKPYADQFTQLAGTVDLLESYRVQRTDLDTRKTELTVRVEEKRLEYKTLQEELQRLPVLQSKLLMLQPYVQLKEQLPAARESADRAREAIQKLDPEIASLQVEEKRLRDEYTGLIGDGQALKDAEAKVTNLKTIIETARTQHSYWTSTLGGIQAKLDAMDHDEAQRVTLYVEMEPLSKQLVRWQILVKAFGRDGIPALIIENAVPELERIANDILGQMSGGKNYLRFETQRELKSGKGMAETLEIIVGDWAGERIYETFSGGEQLRIDFAIRFALAELLARRAGAKVDWLTIDEGFGSQSDEYLPMVIDAVKSVASRFGLVIVISHVKAVQEAFDQKIYFHPLSESVEVKVA